MNKNLLEIASFVLGVPVESLGPTTCASTCDKWNRARLLMLVSQCEVEFGTEKFTLKEIEEIETLGDLERKLTERNAFQITGDSRSEKPLLTESDVLRMIAQTLLIDPSTITPTTRKEKIPEWDSLGIVSIMAMIEDEFHITISFEEAVALNGVPDLLEMLKKNNKLVSSFEPGPK
ncbi:MAG: phosphopantetheine-binding protein [Desulfomonilaceae bacterium]